MSELNIEPKYVISAIDKTDARVFYATDGDSGPYWSNWFSSAVQYRSLDKIPKIKQDSYMNQQIQYIEVLRIDTSVVQKTSMSDVRRNKISSEIEDLRKQLEEKQKELDELR